MAMITVQTNSEEETKKIAEELARRLKPKKGGALVLALSGELGTGKTRFIQGLAKGLGIRKRITSPTFVISKEFRLSPKIIEPRGFKSFFHIDFYRLQKSGDLCGVDFEDILKNSYALVAIEWAERIKSVIPRDAIWIRFKVIGKDTRIIHICS